MINFSYPRYIWCIDLVMEISFHLSFVTLEVVLMYMLFVISLSEGEVMRPVLKMNSDDLVNEFYFFHYSYAGKIKTCIK